MPLTQLAPPYPIFTDKNGDPLDAGYLYFGVVNLNPETNPIQVYYDSALTQPAAQPLRTSNGYVMRNGSPALIYANSQFSVTVRNKNSELVIYSPVGYGIIPGTSATSTDQMTYDQGGTGAVPRVLTSRLQDYVSVKDFGAVGDGVTDDTAAIQAALDATAGGLVHLAAGETYLASSPLNVTGSVDGNGATILGQVQVSSSDVTIRNLNVVSPLAVYGFYLKGLSASRIENVKMQGCSVSFSGGTPASRLGVLAQYIDNLVIDDCSIDYGANLIRCFNYRFTNNVLNGYYQNENELLHATVRSYGIISGNTFLDSLDNWIDLYSSGERTVVTSNRFDGCRCRLGTGIEIKVTLTDDPNNTSGGVNDYGYSQYIVFSDNYVGNSVQSIAAPTSVINVFYLDLRTVPSFQWSEVPKALLISGNIFDGLDTTSGGGQLANAINLSTCEGVIVSDNLFKNINIGGTPADVSSCIWVEGCRNVNITGNYMTSRNGSGITLHGDCDNIIIDGNSVVIDPGNGYSPVFGIYAVKYGSRPVFSITNSAITNNRLEGSLSSMRGLSSNGSFSDLLFLGNTCSNETVLENANRSTINSNVLSVTSTRFRALVVGYTSGIVAFNNITNNTVKSPSGTPKQGIEITRCRASIISQNIIHTSIDGILVSGTNTAGELDHLVVKDNFSVSQTGVNFPLYVSMNATDTATLVADTNQKVT